MPLILGTNSIKDTGYDVANSARFNSGSSDYLSRTYSSDGNQRTWTFSAWLKRSYVGSTGNLIFTYQDPSSTARSDISFANDKLYVSWNPTGSSWFYANSSPTRLFRDVSAWYHLVVACDTTQSTDTNRLKIYINGVQVGSDTHNTYPSQDQDTGFNKTGYVHEIGRYAHAGSPHFDGYMAEVVMIDGSQLTPTSFGEFDEDSNIWKPIDVSGLTFGTNGFYLDFENASSLGADVSGNGNNFTVNNLTSVDQSTDTCTNNFATWNPLDNARTYTGTIDLSEGNLKQSNANDATLISTIALNKGKWYMEFKCEDADNTRTFGIIDIAESNGYVGHSSIASAVSYGYKSSDGTLWIGTSQQASSVGTTSAGDIVSMAIDLDSSTKTIKWQKNGSDLSGTTQLTISHSTSDYYFGIICRCDGGQIISANFGSPPYSISSGNSDADGHGNFEYAVPSGYFALCSKNLAEYG